MMQSVSYLLNEFILRRTSLIENLIGGKLNKRTFLDANYELTRTLRPFVHPDTPEECLYNYHYYNALAKVEKTRARFSTRTRASKRYEDTARNYYLEKDKSTMRMLDFFASDTIHAYPIKTSSQKLDGKLIEIIFPMPYVVFHTCSEKICSRLEKQGVLAKKPRDSVISSYVNALY